MAAFTFWEGPATRHTLLALTMGLGHMAQDFMGGSSYSGWARHRHPSNTSFSLVLLSQVDGLCSGEAEEGGRSTTSFVLVV